MRWVTLMLVLLLAMPSFAAARGRKAPPEPTPVGGAFAAQGGGDVSIQLSGSDSCGTPGTIYIGATPPNLDPNKPILVFVHGKGGCAESWWGETMYHGTNDMYAYAYNNGYQTAFVDLYGEESMWDNGSLLSAKLDWITNYFGVDKVTVIAHSKGGVDTNAASAHYGANDKIRRVITLGSPHWGTPLADLAFSTWTWWLAALMGETTEATYVMQTGYMEYFRSVTDGLDPVPYYTLSGYKCGPIFSAMWYSCAFISGEDDGVVPVWSTRIPGGTHLREGYWDHDEIRMGSRTWSTFAPVIQTAALPHPAVAAEGAILAAAGGPAPGAGRGRAQTMAPGNLILRGGEVTGTATGQAIPLESGVRRATLTIYASSPDFTATLTGPNGMKRTVRMRDQVPAGEIFGGTWVGQAEVSAPAAGLWSLEVASPERAGYLLITSVDSDLQAHLDVGRGVATPGATRTLTVSFGPGASPSSSRVEGALSLARSRSIHTRPSFAASDNTHRATVTLPEASGIHNVTVTVTGTLSDGSAFERTLVTSFAAVHPTERGKWR